VTVSSLARGRASPLLGKDRQVMHMGKSARNQYPVAENELSSRLLFDKRAARRRCESTPRLIRRAFWMLPSGDLFQRISTVERTSASTVSATEETVLLGGEEFKMSEIVEILSKKLHGKK
jgi:hypothetical protein